MNFVPSTYKRVIAKSIDEFLIFLIQSPAFGLITYEIVIKEQYQVHISLIVYLLLSRMTYETLSLFFWNATFGKKTMGLKVISVDLESDQELFFSQCLMRSLASTLSFYFGWTIYVFSFASYTRRHLVDKIALTQVVTNSVSTNKLKLRWVILILWILILLPKSIQEAQNKLSILSLRFPYITLDPKIVKEFIDEYEIDFDYEDSFD